MTQLKAGDQVDIEFSAGVPGTHSERLVKITGEWSPDYGFVLNNNQVATALGCGEPNVRKHKMSPEFIGDGHHYVLENHAFPHRMLGGRPATYWTVKGIYLLCMVIQTSQAAEFRQAMVQTLESLEQNNLAELYNQDDEARAIMGKPSRRPKAAVTHEELARQQAHQDGRYDS